MGIVAEYKITVVFEIHRPKNKALRPNFTQVKPKIAAKPTTVSRLLGRRLTSAHAVKSYFEHSAPGQLHDLLESVELTNLKCANSILTLTFHIPLESLELADDLRRVNSDRIRQICLKLGLQLDVSHYVYGIAASTSSSEIGLDRNVSDCWMHDQASTNNMFIAQQIQRELATRIAIERALLAKAIDDPSNPLLRWIRAPFAASLVRAMPVELLIDRQDTQASYRDIRDVMNLQNLREEVVDRARIWYLSVGTFLTFAAVVLAIFTLNKGLD